MLLVEIKKIGINELTNPSPKFFRKYTRKKLQILQPCSLN